MNPIEQAKRHKKYFVQQIIGNVQPNTADENPTAVFIAGIPGAGKTEFLDHLIGDLETVVRIDLDEIVKMFDGYTPERYYDYRGAANIIVDETMIHCRRNRIDFALDGTFASPRAVDNVRHALKRHTVMLFYVWKDPVLAWQHTKDRELIMKRGIDRDGFIAAHSRIPRNLNTVRHMIANNNKAIVSAIIKDLRDNTFTMTEDSVEIDKLLDLRYTEEELGRMLP